MKRVIFLVALLFIFFGCSEDSDSPSNRGLGQVEVDESIGKPFIQFGHTLNEYGVYITAQKLSPNKKFLVTGNKNIKIWDIKTKKLITTLNGHTERINSISFSPNGKIFATGSNDKTIKLWDLETKKEIITLKGHTDEINSVVFSPNGKILASGGGGGFLGHNNWQNIIKLWDIKTKKEIATLYGNTSNVYSIAFSPNGKILASGTGYQFTVSKNGVTTVGPFENLGKNKFITLWDIETKKEITTLKGHISDVISIAFSPNGKILASLSEINVLKLWNMETKQLIITKKFNDYTNSIVFSPNGKILAFGNDGGIKFMNVETKKIISTFKGQGYPIAFSQNGKFVISNDSNHIIRYINIETGKVISTSFINVRKDTDSIESIHFNSNGFSFIDKYNNIKLCSVKNKELIKILERNTSEVIFSFNGKFLAFKDIKKNIKFWDVETQKSTIMFDGKKTNLLLQAFSQEGKVLALTQKSKECCVYLIKLLDIETKKVLTSFKAETDWISDISLNFKSKKLVFLTAGPGQHSSIELWDIDNKKLISYFSNPPYWMKSVSFSPNGKLLASRSSAKVELWEVETKKLISTLVNPSSDGLDSMVFSPNGENLAIGCRNGTIKIWNIKSKKAILTLNNNTSSINSVSFGKDSVLLFTASDDGIIKIWNIKTGKEILTVANFKNNEWVAITPQGYFNASKNGAKHLNVLTAPLKVTSVDAYYEKFYRPDIVKLALQGKTVDTGVKMSDIKPAPDVEIVGLPKMTTDKQIEVTLKLKDMGGGIGDIRIYRNGVAVNLESRTIQRSQKGLVIKRYIIPLEKGKNKIEAIAFESTNSAKSEPPATANIMANYTNHSKPTLHAVVVGIEEFRNQRLNLRYTKSDATALKKSLERYSKPLFKSVNVTLLTTKEETTKENISQVLTKMKSLNPNDMFLLFVASHGLVEDGDYYLITSNVGSLSKRKLKNTALSQAEITKLISNIPTSKKLIILDTCYSGALGDSIKVALLTRGMSKDTAIKILSRATGTTILSASLSTQQALEGYRGHGLFSYVLLEGLKKDADLNGDGYVKNLELVNYIEDRVPQISEKVFGVEQFPTAVFDGRGFPVTRVE